MELAINCVYMRGPFETFVGSPNYSESELCGGAVTVSFSKYLPWQAMHFLQRSIHFHLAGQKISFLYGTRRFITVLTKARH
jgi:hypothetical protein